ncbi:ATP-binding protein [Sphaerotilus sp.]|uniref:ATP-binding protein n=1 Tax=Sphaerotilus sp. TaxID=2093942 RepID=UPI00286DC78B|nr:ATP-binding protein [Sphaerotilus sp.]
MTPAAPALPRKKLPVGIQTFAKLRDEDCYYVDKSGLAIDLIESGSYFFLSRPRRFGKSLLVDTFKELFEGNRALFEGLAAETRWDWSRRHPVIRISFADGMLKSRTELDRRIQSNLRRNRAALGLPRPADIDPDDTADDLADLIEQAHLKQGAPAVVLVDEYDKPILDNITDPARAVEMRDGLRNLYSVLKGADPHLKFVFLTGVSKFSKVSLFSGLNNLQDITLDARWSALCGYTDHDIDTVFAPELPGLDRDEIRRWYNGYNWRGVGIYNPFDVLLLFDTREFKAHWFDTGTPTFLVKLLAEQSWFTPDLARLKADEMELLSFEVEQIGAVALLFQAGYLSVHAVEETETRELIYTLGYPNREVEMSLNRVLLPGYGVPGRAASLNRQTLLKALRERDWIAMETTLRALFASIPSDWYRKNTLAGFEGHYASVFYSHLAGLGLDLRVEDATNHGRIDLTVVQQEQVFLFEFKVVADEPEGHALRQIRDKGYAEKYLGQGADVHLIGVEFSRTARNVVGFEVETLAG